MSGMTDERAERLQEMEERYFRSLTLTEKRKRELVAVLYGLYAKDRIHQTMNQGMEGYDGYLERLMDEERARELELYEILGMEIAERGEED